MLFSIVVPVYNVEKYLSECLESIIKQVQVFQEDCEILLIDDGSTDNSGKICDEYQKTSPNLIKVFHNTNHGLLLTRRYGYEHATGKYIINCDSDDLLEANMLNNVKRMIEKYNSPDVILFNYYTLFHNKKEYEYVDIFTTEAECCVGKEKVLQEFMLSHSVVSMWGKVYRRSCIDVKKDYTSLAKVSNGEDTLQSIEIYNNAKTFVYINKALYDYRIEAGMTRKFDYNYYFSFKKIFEYLRIQKESWNLPEFEKMFAIKVLQTAGRAITQSRYNKWNSGKEQKEYLKKIAEDELLQENIKMLDDIKNSLQKNHVILLKLVSLKMYFLIVIMLNLKNKVDKEII